jgi:iron(III) transport system ATP-binding protein
MSEVILHDVRKRFGQSVRAVNNLDLHIDDGELFVLLGPSGCGKTTTLRCVGGLEELDGGSIAIGGDLVADAARGLFVPPERRDVGMVFQSYALWPHMDVAQNVGYPLKVRGARGDHIRRGVRAALELVGLSGYERRFPGELSGGQQQRVALARALVAKPRLLLFDEPLSNLDAQLRARLRQDLRAIHGETRFTAVYVTHDHAEAMALADRVAVMNGGRIEQIGTAADIFLSPRTPFTAAFVGFDNILDGRVVRQAGDEALIWIEALGVELPAHTPQPLAAGQAATLAVRAQGLSLLPATIEGDGLSGRLQSLTYAGDHYVGVVSVGGTSISAQAPLGVWGLGRERDRDLLGATVKIATRPGQLVAMPRTEVPSASEQRAA